MRLNAPLETKVRFNAQEFEEDREQMEEQFDKAIEKGMCSCL